MNSFRNSIQLMGRIGQNPEILHLENGKRLAKISLATHESFKTESGDRIEHTHWHSVVFWNKGADHVEQHVKKGQLVLVRGRLTTRSWEDSNGTKMFRSQVVGDEFTVVQ